MAHVKRTGDLLSRPQPPILIMPNIASSSSPLLRRVGLAILLLVSPSLRADQFGLFTYSITSGDAVMITNYAEDAVGAVEIPAEIAGTDKPKARA